jgi:hypothetical protein
MENRGGEDGNASGQGKPAGKFKQDNGMAGTDRYGGYVAVVVMVTRLSRVNERRSC